VGVVGYLFVAGEVGFVTFLLLGHCCGGGVVVVRLICCWIVGVVCLGEWSGENVCVCLRTEITEGDIE